MLKGCKIWAYTTMSLAILSLLFFTTFLVRDRLEHTGILLLDVLDTFLVCLQWMAVGATVFLLLSLILMLVRFASHRQTVQIGPFGTLTRWGFSQEIQEHKPLNTVVQPKKEMRAYERPEEKPVHLIPAYVRPPRDEPDPEGFTSGQSYESKDYMEAEFNSMGSGGSSDSDILERAYSCILDGARGRRRISKLLGVTEHMANGLIEQLKGQGRITREGVPILNAPTPVHDGRETVRLTQSAEGS